MLFSVNYLANNGNMYLSEHSEQNIIFKTVNVKWVQCLIGTDKFMVFLFAVVYWCLCVFLTSHKSNLLFYSTLGSFHTKAYRTRVSYCVRPDKRFFSLTHGFKSRFVQKLLPCSTIMFLFR